MPGPSLRCVLASDTHAVLGPLCYCSRDSAAQKGAGQNFVTNEYAAPCYNHKYKSATLRLNKKNCIYTCCFFCTFSISYLWPFNKLLEEAEI